MRLDLMAQEGLDPIFISAGRKSQSEIYVFFTVLMQDNIYEQCFQLWYLCKKFISILMHDPALVSQLLIIATRTVAV